MSEKTKAHSRDFMSVAFSPDGTKIVSGSWDATIKVWDAVNFRPYVESEWEKVEGDGEEHCDFDNQMIYPYWKNTITGDLRKEQSNAGVLVKIEPETIKVWDAGRLAPKSTSLTQN